MLPSKVLAVDLQAVSYSYPQRDKAALWDISYTFPTGTTAIVGPNGAGKSTLVKLLTGLLEPTSGSISVQLPGGTSLPPDQAHKAVLFQEPSHLYLTIRQNVTMRFERKPTEDARIHSALEVAGLSRVVEGLPDGLDTLVGAGFGGRLDLSGGQWQRLALARLIYRDAPLMILDEPVASLDPEGERAVFELFAQSTQAKIIIFTTHRYDSIPTGTNIVVLVDGRITESGTHEELLQRQRHYWSLYTTDGPTPRSSSGPTIRTAPEERITAPDSNEGDGGLVDLRTYGRDGISRQGAVHNDRLRSTPPTQLDLYPREPGAAAASPNGNHGRLSPNGHRPAGTQLEEERRQSAAHDGEDNLRPVGEPAVHPSEVQERTAPGANGHGDMPHGAQAPGVQEAPCGDGWQSPEDDCAVRVAVDYP